MLAPGKEFAETYVVELTDGSSKTITMKGFTYVVLY
jgi:hypothetical protein